MSRIAFACLVGCLCITAAQAEKFKEKGAPAGGVSFVKEVAPIFVDSCIACHNPKVKKGKYDMSRFELLLKGGSKGAAVVPGKSAESLLSLLMHGDDEPVMPKDADLLPKDVLTKVDQWIDEGARFDGPDVAVDLRDLVPKKDSVARLDYTRPPPIAALAFSPEGNALAVGGYHEVTFWAPTTGKLLGRLPTGAERIHALEYSRDGKLLLEAGGTPGRTGEVVLWDLASKRPARELLKAEDVVFAATFSPDNKQVAAGGADRLFRIWDVASGKELFKIENHADWILALAFTADGKRIFSASRDKSTKIWDQSTMEPVLTFAGHTDGVYGVAVSPDGKAAVSVGADNHVRFWTPDGEAPQVRATSAHANTIFAVRFAPSGAKLFTAGGDNAVRSWNAADGAAGPVYSGHADWVYSIAIGPGEKLLAAGAWDGAVKVWDLASGKEVASFVAAPSAALAEAK